MGVGYQIGLELREVHTEDTIKMQGCSDGGHSLVNNPVLVDTVRVLSVQV